MERALARLPPGWPKPRPITEGALQYLTPADCLQGAEHVQPRTGTVQRLGEHKRALVVALKGGEPIVEALTNLDLEKQAQGIIKIKSHHPSVSLKPHIKQSHAN